MSNLKKCVETSDARIKSEYFEKKQSMANKWEFQRNLLKQRINYNNKKMIFYKKQEIKRLKRLLKEIKSNYSERLGRWRKKKKNYKKRDLRLMKIGNMRFSIKMAYNLGIKNEKKTERRKTN